MLLAVPKQCIYWYFLKVLKYVYTFKIEKICVHSNFSSVIFYSVNMCEHSNPHVIVHSTGNMISYTQYSAFLTYRCGAIINLKDKMSKNHLVMKGNMDVF